MSNWSLYINRTSKILRDSTSKVLRMQGADPPSRLPKTLFSCNSWSDVEQFATGCDADIGGLSSVHFDLDEHSKPATGKFWGEMNIGVKAGLEGKIKGGYAGFRNKRRPTFFGDMVEDLSNHRYLALRLRLGGHPRTHHSYFVNLQTEGPVSTDLWQHRLYFGRKDGGWEELFVPLDNFVLTNVGELATHQITMYREKVRSVGISLLGGNSLSSGQYELGIDWIRAVNEEDVVKTTP